MGIIESVQNELFSDRQCEWDFVGRNKDISRLFEVIRSTKVVEIFGMMQIGKSRLIRELIRRILNEETDADWTKKTILYFNLELYLDEAEEGLIDCLNEAFCSLNYDLKEEIYVAQLKTPTKLARLFKSAIKNNENRSIIFLDNLHVLTSENLDSFKTFMKTITEISNVKWVLTTNIRLQLTAKGFNQYVLGVLEESDILELLHHVTEDRYRARDNTNVENEDYMNVLAKLCEGLPLAALLTGTELKSNDGFVKPSEMIEILLENRLKALSPDIYPEQERLSIYRAPIEKVKDIGPYFSHFLENIIQTTIDRQISMEDAVKATGKDKATVGTTKRDVLKLFDKGVVGEIRGNEIQIHGAIRDSLQSRELLAVIESLPEEERTKHEDAIYKVMMSTLHRVGLKPDEHSLRDPLEREKYIQALANRKGIHPGGIFDSEHTVQPYKDEPTGSDMDMEETEQKTTTDEKNNSDLEETKQDNLKPNEEKESNQSEVIYVRSELSQEDQSIDLTSETPVHLPLNIPCESDSDNNVDDTSDRVEVETETFSQEGGPPAISWRS